MLSNVLPDISDFHILSGMNGIHTYHNVSVPAIDPTPHIYDYCSFRINRSQ